MGENYKHADKLTILTVRSNTSSALNDMQNNLDHLKNAYSRINKDKGCVFQKGPFFPIPNDIY